MKKGVIRRGMRENVVGRGTGSEWENVRDIQ